VIKLVEESNALIVAQENCGGYKMWDYASMRTIYRTTAIDGA